MNVIVLNNTQRMWLDMFMGFYFKSEHELTVKNIEDFLDAAEDDINLEDEQQIYNYLYGVHEEILYHANDNRVRSNAQLRMSEFEETSNECQELLDNMSDSDDETVVESDDESDVETVVEETEVYENRLPVSNLEMELYGHELPVPTVTPPQLAPTEILGDWGVNTMEAENTNNRNYLVM